MKLTSLLTSPALADEFTRVRHDLAAISPTPRHVAVVGASGGEGVTSVAVCLAAALAGSIDRPRVLLAEGNLYRPCLAQELGLTGVPGLRDWDMQTPLPVRPFPGQPELAVLVAGTIPAIAADASPRLAAAVRRARADFDYTVWDTPPVSRRADALAVARECDGALVVLEIDQTRVDALRYLRDALERNHTRILGSVMNRGGRYWPRSARSEEQLATGT